MTSRLKGVALGLSAALTVVPATACAPVAGRAAATGAARGVPAAVTAPTTAAARAGRAAAGTGTYDVVVQKDVRVPMSDGAFLDADIRRPGRAGVPAAGRFPVIVTETPYNKNVPGAGMQSDYLVRHGYVQVVADVRGTGGSPGVWRAFDARERTDGKDLVDWAASPKRPWSDGRIGLFGASYGAINQIFTAAQHPRGLKAIFPVVPMGDAYRDVVGSGGQVDSEFIPLWMGLIAGLGLLPPSYIGTDPNTALRTALAHLGGAGSFDIPLLTDALTGRRYAFDGDFYRQRSPLNVIDKVTVPAYIVGGEYDLFQRGEPMLYQRLAANGVPARLVLGPWYHVDAAAPLLGGALPGTPQPPGPSLQAQALAWFDRYVRGTGAPVSGAPVTYYEIGSGKWRTATRYPPAGVHYRRLFLAGRAAPGRPGMLGAARPGGGPDLVPWVPVAGVCTRSTVQWSAGALARGVCEKDQRANDALGVAYDLPVSTPLRLAGPIDAHIAAASGGRDGELTVRLEDVAPDGSASQLTAGWQVLSLRALDRSKSVIRDGLVAQPWHPFTKASLAPMPATKAAGVDVEIFPTAAVIRPGHRLRVSIQTADFPHLVAPLPQLVNSLGPGVLVHHDAAAPSWIALPVAP